MRKFLTIVFTILGMIVGLFVGPMFKGIPPLSWLAIGGEFGISNPIVLKLQFVDLTFGVWCRVNIAGVLFAIIFALLGHEILRKLKI